MEEILDIPEDDIIDIKRKKIEIKPMNLDEAILQMELLGHNFYMYRDSDLDSVTLVYKRKSGGYGVIETE